jgi:predicted RNA binding protein YcfA (HicA-like mRNA interferase family)
MTRLPVVSGRECADALSRVRFIIRRQAGSHMILRRDEPYAQVSVPDHHVLDRRTLRAIIRRPGLSVEQSVALL